MDTRVIDGAVTLTKCEWMSDWYTIERAEHDGREWLEMSPDGTHGQLMCSARVCDADVEGTAFEMRALAAAIEARTHEYFKRCAVDVNAAAERVYFWSPRNSRVQAVVTLAAADALAAQIRRELGGDADATEQP